VPPDAITPSEKRQTLQTLTKVIQYRLVSSDLPPQMRKLRIGKQKSICYTLYLAHNRLFIIGLHIYPVVSCYNLKFISLLHIFI
jgi:hypothetical protein